MSWGFNEAEIKCSINVSYYSTVYGQVVKRTDCEKAPELRDRAHLTTHSCVSSTWHVNTGCVAGGWLGWPGQNFLEISQDCGFS